ncbi:aldo/keto reductase [Anaerofilum sp. BX8]|uniref:Aldo/keto reductase n=1 Tax=Anaerofilum hominis TaxID=2763016 RepID=A0A923I7E5_9FIRM|nr:aldo/keto reductase [Anaerofilum hominis]MBC5580151.1 aldo/keto reductase [Anaerofilum hominis]
MAKMTLGRTGLTVEQNGFGALPIQRISKEEAVRLLRRAQEGGMTYFDTARAYTDSEEKLGAAFAGMRDKVVIATKTMAQTAHAFWDDLHTSLRLLGTDYVDVYQFHTPSFCPRPGDESGLYDAMLEAKRQGKVRFIGITNHRLDVAHEAIDSGLYDLLMFPFSYISSEKELAVADACLEKGMAFVAMKALCGGLITNSAAACAWVAQHQGVLPIWGIQRERELDEFLSYLPTPPRLDDKLRAVIEQDRRELEGDFCRGCGYCMPCPQGIKINSCARASVMMRRAPAINFLSEEGQAMMKKIEDCVGCGQCAAKCPYGLDTPALLQRNYQDFKEVLAGKPL